MMFEKTSSLCPAWLQAAPVSSTSLLGKRKRAAVSYAEPDNDDLDLNDEDEHAIAADEDEDDLDDDMTYGSRKKLRSTTKKRARLTMPKPKKQKPQRPFPFLSLPPELRDAIYELALTDTNGIALVSSTKAYRRIVCRGEIVEGYEGRYRSGNEEGGVEDVPKQESSLSPNLLAVSKQVHAEGLAWLYKQRFFLEDTMALHTFLAAIGPNNRRMLTNITLEGWGRGRGAHKTMNAAAMTALADCTNLKTLHFDCDIEHHRSPRQVARQLYRDGHFFFESFGLANGRKDAIVDVLVVGDGEFDRAYYGYYNARNPPTEERKQEFRGELRRLLGF